jgi:hypothetical protein
MHSKAGRSLVDSAGFDPNAVPEHRRRDHAVEYDRVKSLPSQA